MYREPTNQNKRNNKKSNKWPILNALKMMAPCSVSMAFHFHLFDQQKQLPTSAEIPKNETAKHCQR